MRARLVSEGRSTRSAGVLGRARECGRGCAWELCWAERGSGEAGRAQVAGLCGMGRCDAWAKLGRVALGIAGMTGFGFPIGFLFSLSISYSFLFLIQTKFEFKYNFEFKPHSNKSMHQHECNTEFLKLRQILITCETNLN